jgi:hypothetical protein
MKIAIKSNKADYYPKESEQASWGTNAPYAS